MLEKASTPQSGDRLDNDDSLELEEIIAPDKPWPGLLDYLKPRSLTARIVLLNLFALAVLVFGILYFNQARQSLIQARIQSLTTQAQIMSAAVAGSASIDTGNIVVNPDQLDMSNDPAFSEQDSSSLDFPINPETTGPGAEAASCQFHRAGPHLSMSDGNLIVDSEFLYGGGGIIRSDINDAAASQPNAWSCAGSTASTTGSCRLTIRSRRITVPDNGKEFPGGSGQRINGAVVSVVSVSMTKNEIIVSVSAPIQRFHAVLGATGAVHYRQRD